MREARAAGSMGNPWRGSYIMASGNLLADFTANANAEMQGRLQVARLYHMTDDHAYHDGPTTSAPMPPPTHPDARFYGTTEIPNVVEKAAGTIQDKLNRE
ncbi:hypothetical protein IWX65_001643 [Arthrobacter sp. CAN_A214]